MTGPDDPTSGRPSGRALLTALALLPLAGFVDAVGLLGFGLFPSFMSGAVTQLGVAVAHDGRSLALLLGGVLATFVAGAFLARLTALRTGGATATLCVETVLLASSAGAAHLNWGAAALWIAVMAMGLQTGVLGEAGRGLGATYVTGALARLGARLADAFAGGDALAWAPQLLQAVALGAGATLGALCYARFGLESLLLAAAVCAAAAMAAALAERRRRPPVAPPQA